MEQISKVLLSFVSVIVYCVFGLASKNSIENSYFFKCKNSKISDEVIMSIDVNRALECSLLCSKMCGSGFNIKPRIGHRTYFCEVFSKVIETCETSSVVSEIGAQAYILGMFIHFKKTFFNKLVTSLTLLRRNKNEQESIPVECVAATSVALLDTSEVYFPRVVVGTCAPPTPLWCTHPSPSG